MTNAANHYATPPTTVRCLPIRPSVCPVCPRRVCCPVAARLLAFPVTVYGAGSGVMKRYDARPVCPSVRPSVPFARYTSVRRVCCCGLAGQEMSIDACTSCVRFSVSVAVSRTPAYAARPHCSATRFTEYHTTILRLSYDNAIVTIDLRRTSNLQITLRRMQCFSSLGSTCKIVRLFVNHFRYY